jgi:hypothetical protein
MTAFAFVSPVPTCRSSSRGQFPARTISSPMSMPSESWTESAVCSNGRPHRVAIRKNRRLLALDPQLVCYSWVTGISEVAQVVFVRKRLVEIQYFQTTISEQQRNEFAQLVEDTIGRIESAQFLPHSGIRFPQNPCSSCPYVGLCLGRQELAKTALTRRPGAENLGWLDELAY